MDYKDSSGFSTPPSASIDTCDSGFTELYCNQMKESDSTNQSIASTTLQENSESNESDVSLSQDESTTPAKTILLPKTETTESIDQTKLSLIMEAAAAAATTTTILDAQINNQKNSTLNKLQNHELLLRSSIDKKITCEPDVIVDQINGNDNEDDDDVDDGNDDDEDNDADDSGSDNETSSNLSRMSELSDVFKLNTSVLPDVQRSLDWVHMQIASGVKPRDCLSRVFLNSPATIPANLSDHDLWRVIASMLTDPPKRERLRTVSSMDDVLHLLENCSNIIVLTGAGVSVSCGIPDFRSRDGIYARLRKEFPEIPDPQSMFDIRYFYQDPRPFYKFAKEIYPGLFTPSPCHRFIRLLEKKRKLLRNYSQNIDTLERVAGIKNVIECHGSFATASCTKCKYKVTSDDIKDDILNQKIPMCPICNTTDKQETISTSSTSTSTSMDPTTTTTTGNTTKSTITTRTSHQSLVERGIMKPDIVFFGESLPDEFHTTVELDKTKCDLLIVIGSSLKVRPVALIPTSLPANVPQILINREQLDNFGFDVELLGDSDVIINQLCSMLGDEWSDICWRESLKEVTELLPLSADESAQSVITNIETNKMSVENNSDAKMENVEIETRTATATATVTSATSAAVIDSEELTVQQQRQQPQQKPPQKTPEIQSTKVPHSITERMPQNTFYREPPNLYIFPGAEIWWDDENESVSSESGERLDDDDDDENDDDDDRYHDEEDNKSENDTEDDYYRYHHRHHHHHQNHHHGRHPHQHQHHDHENDDAMPPIFDDQTMHSLIGNESQHSQEQQQQQQPATSSITDVPNSISLQTTATTTTTTLTATNTTNDETISTKKRKSNEFDNDKCQESANINSSSIDTNHTKLSELKDQPHNHHHHQHQQPSATPPQQDIIYEKRRKFDNI